LTDFYDLWLIFLAKNCYRVNDDIMDSSNCFFFFFCMGDRLNSNIQAVDGKNCVIAEKNGWLTMINFG